MESSTGGVPSGSVESAGQWLQQTAGEAGFDQAEFVGPYAVLRWSTGRGGLALVHSMVDGIASPALVLKSLRKAHGPQLPDRYACVVVAQTSTQVKHPYVPELYALDVEGSGKQYDTTWARLETVLGQSAPWTLARLPDTLLDNISSPAADADGADAPDGLLDLVVSAPTHVSVAYSRARLLAARKE
ncbi:hypothetical protein ACH4TP_32985 [Streptomyces sp. NPDC021012]|uniref:hypothetical protein n=1 Tax=Streptomyces sp. NPDC021012 TaxID=3365107 RepID=UPI00378BDD0E